MKPPTAQGRIQCPDFSGELGWYEAKSVRFRPAAYGLLIHEQKILMTHSRFTGLWDFPGGGVEAFESMAGGMAREFREETGLEVNPGDLVYVAEGYIAMFGHPFHSLRFYYACHLADEARDHLAHDPGEVTELAWWGLGDVPYDQMHGSDQEAIRRLTSS